VTIVPGAGVSAAPAAVRKAEDGLAARAEHPGQLVEPAVEVADVLDRSRDDDGVEALAGERQRRKVGLEQTVREVRKTPHRELDHLQ
jgi:hypothetical protein